MLSLKSTRPLLLLLFSVPAFSQNFILQETTLDRNNSTSYFGTVKRVEMVLRKQGDMNSLPFSSKCTLTSNSFTPMQEAFEKNIPPSQSPDYGKVMIRDFKSGKDKIIKLTYGKVPPDKSETIDYVQLVVIFNSDSKNPQIDDVQIKNKVDVGILKFNREELDYLRNKTKPKPAVVAQKPATGTKTAPKSSGTKSAGTKSTGTKSTGTKSTGAKSTGTKPAASKSTGTKPAATPPKKN